MASQIAQLLNTSGGDAERLTDLLLEYVDSGDGDNDSTLNDDTDCSTDDDDDADFDMTRGDFESALDAAKALPEVVMGEEEERHKVTGYRYVFLQTLTTVVYA